MRFIAYIFMTIIIGASFIGMGFLIKQGLVEIRSADRYVAVKGLAEQDVKADLAIWPIPFKVADNSLDTARAELDRQTNLILQFLTENGIKSDEISVNRVMINDAYAQQYQQSNVAARYAIDKTIMVRTNNVDAVAAASQKVGDLISQGVLIGYNAVPLYSYTQLNTVKPQMIAAATQNARSAAQQFANDSGAVVGNIRSATQGYFSISARDDVAGISDAESLNKKIRVVSTVEYYLND